MLATTLGLGIGASAAMFGVVDRLLLRGPAHVERSGELRRIYVRVADGNGASLLRAKHPYALYRLLRNDARAFSAVAAHYSTSMRAGEGPEAPSISASYTTADFWPLVGARPALGRFFSADEDQPPGERDVVVLGYGLWQRQFASDRRILGRAIRLGGRMRTVIGVAPRDFTGTEWSAVDAWLPMTSEARPAGWESYWDASLVRIIGRLKPSIREGAAGTEATELLRNGYAGSNAAMRNGELVARPISYGDQGTEPPELAVARLLLGVAIVVMLVAASNAAHLLLARGLRQRREIAIRIALGAGRGQLTAMLLIQATALALLGGVAGVIVAYWGGALARATLFPTIAWGGATIDGRVLGFMVAAVAVVAVLIGAIPAGSVSAMPAGVVLASGSAPLGAAGGGQQRRARSALQVVQIALSMALLLVAGLFVRSLMIVERLDLGIRPDQVLSADVALSSVDSTRDERHEWQQLLERVRALPGVERAAIAVSSPFGNRAQISLRVSGRDSVFGFQESGPFIYAVTPGYFETMGTPVRSGRVFDAADREGSEPVAIINETMARLIWPGRDPLGQCLYLMGFLQSCSRVIGIVADARQSRLREDPVMQYYVPFGQEIGIGGNMLLVRAAPRLSPDAFIPALRTAIRTAVPSARSITVETLASRIEPQVRPWRMGARMFGLFGVLALLVATVGVFSVVSILVSQRRHELGVRMALGAKTFRIVGLVLGRSLGETALGAALGIAATYALAPFIQPYLFENSAHDPGVLIAATAVLAFATTVASVVPTVRACRVSPVVALRAE